MYCEYTCWTENGYGVSMCVSLPKFASRVPSLEQSHHLVRGNMGLTGYFWKNTEGTDPKKPIGENSMSIDLTYLFVSRNVTEVNQIVLTAHIMFQLSTL